MASAQEVEMLRRQLDELSARMEEVREQSSTTAMNAAVTGLTEAVRSMGQSVSKPRPEDMTFNGYAGTLDLAYPALLNLAVATHDAHTERSTESREESWKQRFRSFQTSSVPRSKAWKTV